jgi:hypothetical protein
VVRGDGAVLGRDTSGEGERESGEWMGVGC